MKHFNTAHFRCLLIVVLLLSLLGLASIAPSVKMASAQAPQVEPVADAYGNVVRNGDRRYNYLVEEQRGFTRVELDEQGPATRGDEYPVRHRRGARAHKLVSQEAVSASPVNHLCFDVFLFHWLLLFRCLAPLVE